MNTTTFWSPSVNLMHENLARERIFEAQRQAQLQPPEVAEAIRAYHARRRARRWERLARWAARRAEVARR